MAKPAFLNKQSAFYALSLVMSEAGYKIVNIPLLFTDKTQTRNFLSVAFDDSCENVWIAGTGISSTDMEHIVNHAKSIIHETLDMPVHINAILIAPTDKPAHTKSISYAQSQKNIQADTEESYILIFNTLQQASDYMQANPNKPQKDISHLPDALLYYEKTIELLNTELYAQNL